MLLHLLLLLLKKKQGKHVRNDHLLGDPQLKYIFFFFWIFTPDPWGFIMIPIWRYHIFQMGWFNHQLLWFVCNFWIHVGWRLKKIHSVYGFRCLKNTWKPAGGWSKHRQSLTSYTRWGCCDRYKWSEITTPLNGLINKWVTGVISLFIGVIPVSPHL